MANEYFVNAADLALVASMIREKADISDQLVFPNGFVTAIGSLSTGGGLNFEVVGGTERPENPRENTIWVNTELEIVGYSVSPSDPSLTKTGELYKNIGTTSGYYLKADGSQTASANWSISDLISLPENTKSISVRTGKTSAASGYHAFYDASGNFISTVLRGTEMQKYNVPTGAAYVRLTIRVDDITSLVATYATGIADGFVWFRNDDIGLYAFDDTDGAEGFVSPISCKQYMQGSWETTEAYIYKSGKWTEIRAFLLNGSDECWNVTGGWDRKPYRANDTGSWFIDENGITVIGTSPSMCIGLANFNPNILSRFNTLRGSAQVSNVGNDGQTVFGIRSSNTMPDSGIDTSFVVAHEIVGKNGALDFAVDISEINSGYVVFTCFKQTITFNKLWLE